MNAELLSIRASLHTLLGQVDDLITSQPLDPAVYLDPLPASGLARVVYAQVQMRAEARGLPVPSHSQIKAALLAQGWTLKKVKEGFLLSPPLVRDLS